MAKKKNRNTKGKIVSAAWDLFYRQGYENTTLAGVFLRCAQSCQNGRLALWRIIENAQRI